MAEMDRIHTKHPYMGQRKIVKKLEDAGFKVGRKLVRSYMQQMGIFPIYPKPNLSKRNFKEGIMPYLLRNMNIYMPNQVWSIDITFIKMLHGHMYLTAIIDWYSRKIVGWNLSDTLDTVHVINAVLNDFLALFDSGFSSTLCHIDLPLRVIILKLSIGSIQ